MKKGILILLVGGVWSSAGLLGSTVVWAGVMELSGSFSYSRSNYDHESSSDSRRFAFGVGYYFFGDSELEFEVQDVLYHNRITNIEDTTFHDQIYSLDWVQSFAPRGSFFRPYFKVGIGQLNRTASGYYPGGVAPPAIYDSITGVLGVGLKMHLYEALALRMEGSTYLINGAASTAADNFSLGGGLSVFF